MLNVIIVVGRLTKDPIQREAGAVKITNFSVAIDTLRKDENGEKGATFLDVVAFNAVGESVALRLHKGSKVAVKGAIQQRNYVRKDGSKGVAYEIIADSVEFLDPKPQTEEEPEEEPKPKFDPMTGKPLTEQAKRK